MKGVGLTAFLMWGIFWLGGLFLTLWGAVLAFKASLILGFIALLIEPSPFILGLCALLGHPDVAQRLAHFLGL